MLEIKRQTALDAIRKLSDSELKKILEEFKSITIEEDSLTRTLVREVYGKIDIFVLQMTELLWPLLEVISERMFAYSPHIEK